MKKHPQKPSLVKKLLLAVGSLLIVTAGASLAGYFLTLKDPRLPDFPLEAQILTASLPELTEKISALEAGDLALASAGLSSLKTVLQEWESSGLSAHVLGKFLLSSPASAGLSGEGGWIIAADLGWKGLWAPLALGQLTFQDQPLLGRPEDEESHLYFHPPGQMDKIWIQVHHNLLLMGSSKELLARAVQTLESPLAEESSSTRIDFPEEGLRFTVSADWASDRIASALPGVGSKFLPDGAADGITVNLRLDDRTLVADFPWKTDAPRAEPLPDQSAWSLLPRDTIFALICPWIPQVIFPWAGLPVPGQASLPWAGGEIGVFYHSGAADPVAFIGFKERKLWEEARKTLVSPTTGRLILPEALQSLFQLADFPGTEVEYFELGDFLFFSPSALGLAPLKKPVEQTLATTAEFQALTTGILPSGTLSAYTDLDRKTPSFFQDPHPFLGILRLYSRNLFRLIPMGQGWKMEIRGLKGRSPLTRTVPGYPLPFPENATAPFSIIPNSEGTQAKLAYGLSGGGLILQDPLDFSHSALPSLDAFPPIPGVDDQIIYIPGEAGMLDAFRPDGNRALGFPKPLGLEGPIQGVPFPGGILTHLGKELVIHRLTPNTRDGISLILPATPKGIPLQRFGYVAMMLGDQGDSALLLDLRGKALKGWPKAMGYPLAGPPVMLKSGSEIHVALAGLDGDLTLSDLHGDLLPGYPLKLQESLRTSPEVIRLQDEELLVFLSTSGKVIIFDPAEGKELRSVQIAETTPKSKITVYDGNRDGKPEIFLSGIQGQVLGFDAQLIPLPDFPVHGTGEPQFSDLDGDGFLELLSFDDSRRVYAYSLRY